MTTTTEAVLEAVETLNKKPEPLPLSLSEFLMKNIPPVEYVVTDIVQKKGKAMVSAAPNVGKSIFTSNLALDIANGTPKFMGKFAVTPARVLYLDLEMGEAALKERFQKMCELRSGGTENLFVHYLPTLDLLCDESKKLIEDWLTELKVDVLILDPLGNAWCGDESKQEMVGKLTGYLNTLIEKFGIAILVVHHWRKATKDSSTGGQMAAGSYKWAAWIDTHITLEGNPSNVTVSCHKNRNRPRFDPFMVKLNTEALGFEFIADFQTKFDSETLDGLFDSFGALKVSVPEMIKRSKEQSGPSRSTIYRLIEESKSFAIEKEGKTHFLVRNPNKYEAIVWEE